MTDTPSGLALLRAPFAAHHISKLPKESKAQADERKADRKAGINCQVCGGWHHRNAVHLDYVGHAALTDRLLDADPAWSWEPAALRDGLPAFDQSGGLWIRLTVCGVTRLGYGHAAAKPQMDPGAREKEVIGDALRNAAMRFGAALDLWHKGDLHPEDDESPRTQEQQQPQTRARASKDNPYESRALDPDAEFPGVPEGNRGKTSHFARQAGDDKLFKEISGEIVTLESPAAVGAFIAGRKDAIAGMPAEWRAELRGQLQHQQAIIAEQAGKERNAEDDFRGDMPPALAGRNGHMADAH